VKPSEIKLNIRNDLFEKLGGIQGVISVTIVGSFVNQEDLSGISDIDTIVICSSLDKKLFDACLNAVENIDLRKCGLGNYSLKINPTFGPLKFDDPTLAVVHLMVYGVSGHRKHVIASPFTCFDWERSEARVGPSLKQIFPVGQLQFRDFMEVRRSLENYFDDLEHNVISYREYDFTARKVTEIKKNKPLDERHRGEYAYHIVRNLVANYLKLCNNRNDSFSNNEIKAEIKRLFSEKGEDHTNKFDMISAIKSQRVDSFPEDTVTWTKNFLTGFQQCIKAEWSDAIPIHFIRHYQTKLNNGTYLGQGRDPGIDKSISSYPKYDPVYKVYSSPMRRCMETAAEVYKEIEIEKDDRLLEFDYGCAEGLQYDELVQQYPEISAGWKKGEDPHFPAGENTTDVFGRLTSFLEDLTKVIDNHQPRSISIFTHNGVLRCLLGDAFGLVKKDWYKLVIPHGVPLEFLFRQNRFYPNISRSLWAEILQNIGYSAS
tara:strand:+ start:5637 stop:7097 length:1461 start_codon:yes stop_codon:yes gene_type:complete